MVSLVTFAKNSIYLTIKFYVCAVSDDPCERGNTTVTISADEARQDAQIIGYVLLMTGSGFILLCEHFCTSFPYILLANKQGVVEIIFSSILPSTNLSF